MNGQRSNEYSKSLYSSGEACRYLGVSYQYLESLTRRPVTKGGLQFFATESGRIFLVRDVERLQDERRKKAPFDRRIRL